MVVLSLAMSLCFASFDETKVKQRGISEEWQGRAGVRNAIRSVLEQPVLRPRVQRALARGSLVVPFVEKGMLFDVSGQRARSIPWLKHPAKDEDEVVEIFCLVESKPRKAWEVRRFHLEGVLNADNIWFRANVGFDGQRWRVVDLTSGFA